MLPIQTARLLLRPLVQADAATLAAYRSDPVVARYQGWETPYALASATQLIEQMQGRDLSTPLPGAWNQIAVQLRAAPPTSPILGDCVFRMDPDGSAQASIGFTLATPHQHRGYATEAARALVGALFATLGLHRVTAVCDARNVSSQHVLERLGMRREAHFVQNIHFKGEWGSEFAYAILRSEWRE